MKTALLPLGLSLLTVAALRADVVLVQKVEGTGQSGEMTVKVKGTRIRSDISPEISTITDTASGVTRTLMRSQKIYIEMNAETTRRLAQNLRQQVSPSSGGEAAAPPHLEATGRHETVNGYDTELYTVQTGGLKTRYWIARDYPQSARLLGIFKQLQSTSLSEMAREMAPQPTDFPGVPVKTEMEVARGQKVTITLLSAREQPLDDSEFATPADYKALATPSFPQPSP